MAGYAQVYSSERVIVVIAGSEGKEIFRRPLASRSLLSLSELHSISVFVPLCVLSPHGAIVLAEAVLLIVRARDSVENFFCSCAALFLYLSSLAAQVSLISSSSANLQLTMK